MGIEHNFGFKVDLPCLNRKKVFSKGLPRGIEHFIYLPDIGQIVCSCEKSIISFEPFGKSDLHELTSYSMAISCLQATENLVISGTS